VILIAGCGYEVPLETVPEDNNKGDTTVTMKTTSTSREICKVQAITWTPGDNESILLDPMANVFPGAVLDAESFQNGKFILIDDQKRKPVTVYVNGPIFKGRASRKNVYPKGSDIVDSVNTVLKDSIVGSPPTKLVINIHEIYSRDHLNILLKGKYSGGIAKVEAGFNFDDLSIKSRYLLDVTQIFYEVNIDHPGRSGFFKDKPTLIGDISPLYVSQVKYGRRIMIALESTQNIQGREAQLKAEFGTFAKSSTENKIINDKFLTENTLKVLIMGGDPDDSFRIFRSVNNRDSLYAAISRGAKWSLQNLGVPLAYTLNKTSDGSIFNVGQTSTYIARKCEVKPTNEWVLKSPEVLNICPGPNYGGDDREFAGDLHFTATINVTAEGNSIFAVINANWQEDDGNTSGTTVNYKMLLGVVPDSLEILDITSAKSFSQGDIRIPGYGPYNVPMTLGPGSSCVQALFVVGDSPNEDDMYPGECADDIHTKIKRIVFFPIKLNCTRRGDYIDDKSKTSK
jgi:hypothetical protein